MSGVDGGEAVRNAAQRRAIDIHRPAGALMTQSYLERTQEIIPVNRTDLEDLGTFDNLSKLLGAVGLFFVSGPLWLAADKYFSSPAPTMTPVLMLCVCSAVFGIFALALSGFLAFKRRGRVARIFAETKPVTRDLGAVL